MPKAKYQIRPNKNGNKKLDGSSETTFPKKYAVGEYILLFTSLKNIGLSSGKSNMILLTEPNPTTINAKNKAPLILSTAALVYSGYSGKNVQISVPP